MKKQLVNFDFNGNAVLVYVDEDYSFSGWGGEDAVPISELTLKGAKNLISKLPREFRFPDSAPGIDGSLCMEWLIGEAEIFIDFNSMVQSWFMLISMGKNTKMAFPDLIMQLSNIFFQFFRKFEDKLLPLKAGRPAKSDDIWFRDITSTDHIREKDGVMRLHHAAFKGKAISQPSHKIWLSEISGRLNSKAETIESIKSYGELRAELAKKNALEK